MGMTFKQIQLMLKNVILSVKTLTWYDYILLKLTVK